MKTTVAQTNQVPITTDAGTRAHRPRQPFAAGGRWLALALVAGATVAAQAQAPVIASFGSNGELVCTNLPLGSVASVEWAASLTGPWTNSWAGLDVITPASNGTIRVSVPMFYRVLGITPPTNPPASASMALIPGGPFTMGDNLDGDSSAPPHTNQISAFYIDKFEVTMALWAEVQTWANIHGYDLGAVGLGKASNHPVYFVSWYDAVKWCNARSEKECRTPAYFLDAGLSVRYRSGQVEPYVNWSSGYRLPTEAEWEKAARGGVSGQRFPWGNTISWSQVNYYASPGSYPFDLNPTNGYHPTFKDGILPYTSPVGYFAPNGYGIYDMAGNLWEWTWDYYGSYSIGAQTDPHGPGWGSRRLLRGGSWDNYNGAFGLRTAFRRYQDPLLRGSDFGFRSVLPTNQP